MGTIARLPDDELRALRQGVQQRLGQCVLRLQAYEQLLKAVLAQHEVTGTAHHVDRDARAAETGRKTLGMLVNQLFGSLLTPDSAASSPAAEPKLADDGTRFRFRMQIALPTEELARIEDRLRDFVSLRNALIHHFLEQHDLQSFGGCRLANEALDEAACRIKRHFDELSTWVRDLAQASGFAAEALDTDWARSLLVTGRMPWPETAIVGALRQAAAEIAKDGWTPVQAAAALIAGRHPDQLPSNYGCSSWRQVLHESGIFELRYRVTDGQRAAWYREKAGA